MLVAIYDQELGMIRSTAEGILTEQEIESHLVTMEVLVKRARAHSGRALHLVDATGAALLAACGSKACIKEGAEGRVKVDRVAVVKTSTLAKLQTLRLYKQLPQKVYDSIPLQAFYDMDEAIAWLQAFQPPAKVAAGA